MNCLLLVKWQRRSYAMSDVMHRLCSACQPGAWDSWQSGSFLVAHFLGNFNPHEAKRLFFLHVDKFSQLNLVYVRWDWVTEVVIHALIFPWCGYQSGSIDGEWLCNWRWSSVLTRYYTIRNIKGSFINEIDASQVSIKINWRKIKQEDLTRACQSTCARNRSTICWKESVHFPFPEN